MVNTTPLAHRSTRVGDAAEAPTSCANSKKPKGKPQAKVRVVPPPAQYTSNTTRRGWSLPVAVHPVVAPKHVGPQPWPQKHTPPGWLAPLPVLRLQEAARQFVNIDSYRYPFAVTLTLKQGVRKYTAKGSCVLELLPDRASQNVRHFLNLLNRKIFGTRAKRYGARLRVFTVLEGTRSKRLHVHLLIDCPRHDLVDGFPALIKNLWERTDWGHRQVKVESSADSGWIAYITKLRDKADFAESIDWLNTTT